MTARYLAAGDGLNLELTDAQFATLNTLSLVAPCNSCTEFLAMAGTEDEVIYHARAVPGRNDHQTMDEIAAIIAKRH